MSITGSFNSLHNYPPANLIYACASSSSTPFYIGTGSVGGSFSDMYLTGVVVGASSAASSYNPWQSASLFGVNFDGILDGVTDQITKEIDREIIAELLAHCDITDHSPFADTLKLSLDGINTYACDQKKPLNQFDALELKLVVEDNIKIREKLKQVLLTDLSLYSESPLGYITFHLNV